MLVIPNVSAIILKNMYKYHTTQCFSLRGKIFNISKFVFISALIFSLGGFFVASTALAEHDASVTVNPDLVAGNAQDTYIFTISNNISSTYFIYRIEITAPAGFTINNDLNCPSGSGWTNSVTETTAICVGNPFGEPGIMAGEQDTISFLATAPGVDSTNPWVVKTQDSAGDWNTAYNPITIVDATAPIIESITTKDTNGDGKVETATIVFSEPVDDSTFSPADFTIGGVAASSFGVGGTPDDNTFDVLLTNGVDGTQAKDVTYTHTQGNGADLVGNLLANVGSGNIAEIDQAKPVFLSAKTTSVNTIDLTFSENLDDGTVSNDDFGVDADTSTNNVTSVATNGNIITLTLTNPIAPDSTPTIYYNNTWGGGVGDPTGNISETKDVVASDGIAPTLNSAVLKTSLTVDLTFNENIAFYTSSEADTLGKITLKTQNPTGIVIVGNVATLTFDTSLGTAAITNDSEDLEIAANAFKDLAVPANVLAQIINQDVSDEAKPTVVSATAYPDPAKAGDITITVVFSENMNTGVNPTLQITGITDSPTVSQSTYSGDTWTGTFTLAGNNEEKTATIVVAGAVDTAENVMDTDSTGTFKIDTINPVVTSITVSNNSINEADVSSNFNVIVTFSEEMDPIITPIISFDVNISTTLTNPSGAWSDGDKVYTITYIIVDADATVAGVDVIVNTAQDLAGNVITEKTVADLIDVDTLAPAITSVVSNAKEIGWLKVGNTITFTVTPTISETGLIVNPVIYNGGTLSWSTADSGVTYIATYTVEEDQSDQTTALQLMGVALTDSVGNTGGSADGFDVAKTIDANTPTAPTISATDINIINSTMTITGTGESDATVNYSIDDAGNTATNPITGTAAVSGGVINISEINVSSLDDGILTVNTTLTDAAGNISGVDTDTATKDTLAPVVNITAPLNGSYINGDTVITFATDSTNPHCSVDDSNWTACISGTTKMSNIAEFVNITEGALFTLYLKDTDSAGNTGTDNESGIIKDTTPPDVATISIDGGNVVTKDETPALTLTAGTVVPDYMRFSCNNSVWGDGWVTWTETYDAFDITTGVGCSINEGEKTVYVQVKDNHENIQETTGSDTIIYDGDNTLTVGATGKDFTTIQSAINAATIDDTIEVAAGIYDENVVIDKDITLQSSGAAVDTTINAFEPTDYVVNITVDGVTLDGFTITGYAATETGPNGAVNINAKDSCTITNNILTNNRHNAINLYSTGGEYSDFNTVSNNVINAPNGYETYGIKIKGAHNTISGNKIYNADTSIHIWSWNDSETASPDYNIISGNTIAQGSGNADHKYGIEIKTGQHNEVTDNTISVTRAGIHLYTSDRMAAETNFDPRPANNIISGNTITSGEVGIVLLEGARSNTISNNDISGTSIAGILGSLSRDIATDWAAVGNSPSSYLAGTPQQYLQITGNTFEDNTLDNCGHGIAMEYADNNIIGTVGHGNTIKNNANTAAINYHDVAFTADYAGIYFDANSEGNVVNYNTITGNTGGLKNANTETTLNAENNWWDSVNGPEHSSNTYNVGSQGDAVSDDVDFTPWLDAAGGSSFAPVENTSTGEKFASIQAAIDAASADDIINVAAGIYDEQVKITTSLTLQGAGDTTIIQPSSETKITSLYTLGTQTNAYWNGYKLASIIEISGVGTADVTVKNLKVDGVNINTKPAGATYIVGISYGETGGIIDNVKVVNMDTTSVTTSDRTYGIWLDAVTTAVSVEVKASIITLYNKNGINARGAELTVSIHNNIVTGPGESPCVPNGILLINDAKGTVGPNNTITNHLYTGEWTAKGILTWDVDGIIIEGNTISNCGSGIGLEGPNQGTTNSTIQGNIITDNERGVYLECPNTTNNTITSNDIQGNEYGIYLSGPDEEGQSSTYVAGEEVGAGNIANSNNITGNTVYGVRNFNPAVLFDAENNWWGASTGPNTAGTDSVSANVDFAPYYTDAAMATSSTSYSVCATGCNFVSIQDAINAASSGDTINVADGTYTIISKILVNKENITITGNVANPENVVVQYSPANSTLNCVEVNSADVTIQGIKVQNCKNGFHFDKNVNTNTGVTISNCIIEDISGWGIGEISSPNTLISHNIITNAEDFGIYFRKCEGTNESNRCEAISNTISNCSKTGGWGSIQTYFSKYAYIYDNTISSTNDKGINIIRSGATGMADRVQVIGNTISETKWPGIQVIGAPYTYVYNNTLTNCNYYGLDGTGDWDYASIHVQDDIESTYSHHTIIDNNIVSEGVNGIQTWSNDVTITNNEIYNMGTPYYADTKTTGDGTYKNSGILVGSMYGDDPTGVVITNNNIHDNYWGLFYKAGLINSVTAESNWWGSANGPTHALNPGTNGNSVSNNVDYRPWRTTAILTDLVDETAPTVIITVPVDINDPTNISPISFIVTFDENITNFEANDIEVTNGVITENSFSGSGSTYNFTVTPTSGYQGAVKIDIAAEVAWDLAGNYNTVASQFSIVYDSEALGLNTVSIASNNTDGANPTWAKVGNTITVTIIADENIQTPTVTIAGDSATVSGADTSWTATYIMTSEDIEGTVAFAIDFTDIAENSGIQVTATTDSSNVTFDKTAPVVNITAPLDGNKVNGDTVITFTTDSNSSQCSINDTDWTGCTSGTTKLSAITKFGEVAEDASFTLYLKDTDTAGNAGTDSEAGIIKDTASPTVLSHAPSLNAVNVEPDTDIVITFDEVVIVEEGDVTFEPAIVGGFVIENSGTEIVTINPNNSLDSNKTYTVTLAGVTDEAGNVMGDYNNINFTTATHYNISLYSTATGWNLVSLPVVPNDTSIATVLGNASASINAVWTYDPLNSNAVDGWLVHNPDNSGTNNLTDMTAGYGYWVSVKGNTSISGWGSLLTAGPTVPPSRILSSGWNLIGYYQIPGEDSSTPNSAFSSLGSSYTGLWGYNNEAGGFKSTVPTILPGDGFWISLPTSGKTYTPSNIQ